MFNYPRSHTKYELTLSFPDAGVEVHVALFLDGNLAFSVLDWSFCNWKHIFQTVGPVYMKVYTYR